ncbi:MAG: sulfatase, partial [Planctomycetaceae bacterium]
MASQFVSHTRITDMRLVHLVSAVAVLVMCQGPAVSADPAKRPNFVFLVSEDNSLHYMKLYGAQHGETPNIAALARHGLVFNHAFSCSPVCSVARSTLATGIFAPRGGFQYHRKMQLAPLPAGVAPWSAVLKNNGYYTTNRRKTDYNFRHTLKRLWNDSSRRASWRNRLRPDMPFFHMQSFGQSHESSLHFPARQLKQPTSVSPKTVELPPYHPDTPTFRYTHARYFDRISVIDQQIGRLVSQLESDGLLEDTFIFYFGDHGGVLPRSKGYAYESGLHVPMVVRIPDNFSHLVDHTPGTRLDGFVSFVDFGPTLLNLADLPLHPALDGRPFLGKGVSAKILAGRDESFGYADRFDEKYDLVRSLRKGRFTYIRNFQAFYPDGLQNNYRYRMLAFTEWRKLHQAGKLNSIQAQFFSAKSPEALFDLEKDPHEVHNLAGDPEHTAIKLAMRRRLRERVKALPDLSFFPESVLYAEAMQAPAAYGQLHKDRIGRLVDTADLCLLPPGERLGAITKALASNDPWIRYW